MKIKVSLNTNDEWNDCWLETKYVDSKDEIFNLWIYPSVWPNYAKNDGFFRMDTQIPTLKQWIKECENYIKTPITIVKNKTIYDRTITAMQKISRVFSRIFPW